MSRPQLQRALLDAAAIFSSAANIARRAAAIVDTEAAVGQRSVVREARSAPSPASQEQGQHASSSRLAARGQPVYVPVDAAASAFNAPWPSKAQSALQQTSTSQRVETPTPSAPSASDSSPVEALSDAVKKADSVGPATDSKGVRPVASEAKSAVPLQEVQETIARSEQAATPQYAAAETAGEPSTAIPHTPSALSEQISTEQPETSARTEKISHQSPLSPSQPLNSILAEADEYDATKENAASPLRAAKVPSSRIARLLHYGSLGAGLAWGAAGSYIRGGNPQGPDGKQFMSDDNVRRLVDKLSTMRGAALKLGQFMSIQDSNLLPEQIEQVMLRVQNSAHYMPQWQMEQVMRQDLGADWRSQFETFEDVPFASASIGQVHAATLSKTHPSELAGQKVAVKVQFPGVRESIGSDLNNLRWLVSASALLPRGLFLDNTIRVMRRELDDECDYLREKEMCVRFGAILNKEGSGFAVPRVVDELCSARVLTCEMMRGRPLTQASRYSQETRDRIAHAILKLSLQELFQYRLMQTDPNWTNFLYNERTGKVELIDFGATREYTKEFMDDWLCMLRAAISGDRASCIHWSEKVGYLTGDEGEAMQTAHVDSMIALGEPFRPDAPSPYLFAGQTITERVRAQIPLMLRERLTPPPEPTYSLNRKLSGAFLLCARLRANVKCSQLFDDVTRGYRLGSGGPQSANNASLDRAFKTPSGARGFATSSVQWNNQTRSDARNRRLNLANRWPKHIVSAVESSLESSNKDGTFVTLAADPASPSIQGTSQDPQKPTSATDLIAKAVGGLQTRPNDPAESPTKAYKKNRGKDPNVPAQPASIRGISIPEKPKPPGPEDCCMSGCARCVYDLYAEDLQDYQQDLSVTRTKLQALSPPLDPSQWDEELLGPRPKLEPASPTGDAKQQDELAKARAEAEVDAIIGKLDPSMQAFLQLERSLKKKGTHKKTNAKAAKRAQAAAANA